jgi:5-methylthioadenosine/S-adenosylhomocysteine deaminase
VPADQVTTIHPPGESMPEAGAKVVDLRVFGSGLVSPLDSISLETLAPDGTEVTVVVAGVLDVVEIGPADRLVARYQDAETLRLPKHVLMPGLINAHGHCAMSLLRGIGDDMALKPWLEQRIWPIESKLVDRRFVADGTELAIAEMLRGGTTCCNEMYFFPDVAAATAARLGFRMSVGLIVIEFASRWATNVDEYLSRGMEVRDEFRAEPLISTTLAPHAPYTVGDATLDRIQTLSAQLDIPVHIHLHETAGEVDESIELHGCRPFERLRAHGLINEQLLAVHMTQFSDGEIQQAQAAGVNIVHCPESNQKLASGACPVEKLRQAGVNVTLGTDGAASNNDLDLFGEMRSAALMGKLVAEDATAVPASYALEMATINGARALGLEDQIGSLEPGKSADLVALELDRFATTPVYDVISHLVYAVGRYAVSDVWIQGQRLLHGGQLSTINESDLMSRAHAWGDLISATLKEGSESV